jgi:tRNA(Ile)-lysidine synthase
MDLLTRYRNFIQEQQLFSAKDILLLAVSGGVDSVVLCELCSQCGFRFRIVHCNFQLRGEESERDERFVKALAKKYNAEIYIKKFDTEQYAAGHKISLQEAARALRYEWFEELVNGELSMIKKQKSEARFHHWPYNVCLLTAHHADDNAETVLMNFCRGTGLHGLTGIPLKYGHIRRPLLPFTKEDLIQFARQNSLQYVEDTSNLSAKYTRNLFRNEILPSIAKAYPQVKQNLLDNIGRFTEIEKLYKLAVAGIKKKLVKQKGAEWHIPVKQLMGYRNRALIYEIISDFGFTEKQIDEVIKLAESESGRYLESPQFQYRLIRHRHWFIISPVNSAESSIILIEESDEMVLYENGILVFGKSQMTNDKFRLQDLKLLHSGKTALLDAGDIRFPLILRKWKAGDYFYPLGMKKKKKLSRFFIDLKLSKPDKEKVWVLESDKRILWVVGYRIDERFKVTEKTKSVLEISLR